MASWEGPDWRARSHSVLSWASGPQAVLHEGVAVLVTVNLRSASGAVLRQVECRNGRSATCDTCLVDVLDIAMIQANAVDASSNTSVSPISAPDSVYDVVTGTAALTIQHGLMVRASTIVSHESRLNMVWMVSCVTWLCHCRALRATQEFTW